MGRWLLCILGFTIFDEVALTHGDLVCNLGAILDSQLLLEEQVTFVIRRAFAQLQLVHQLLPFLDRKALLSVTHAHFSDGLL